MDDIDIMPHKICKLKESSLISTDKADIPTAPSM